MKEYNVNIRGSNFRLTKEEAADLKRQLARPSPWFVALNQSGYVVAEGPTVERGESESAPDGINLRLGGEVGSGWWYFGSDQYVIVTEEQYNALIKAGLAYARSEEV